MILYFRNDKKDKSKRFLLFDSKWYDATHVSLDIFCEKARETAKEYGYNFEITKDEYARYIGEY